MLEALYVIATVVGAAWAAKVQADSVRTQRRIEKLERELNLMSSARSDDLK